MNAAHAFAITNQAQPRGRISPLEACHVVTTGRLAGLIEAYAVAALEDTFIL